MKRTCHVATLLWLIYSPVEGPQVRLQIELPDFLIRRKIDSLSPPAFSASFSLSLHVFFPAVSLQELPSIGSPSWQSRSWTSTCSTNW